MCQTYAPNPRKCWLGRVSLTVTQVTIQHRTCVQLQAHATIQNAQLTDRAQLLSSNNKLSVQCLRLINQATLALRVASIYSPRHHNLSAEENSLRTSSSGKLTQTTIACASDTCSLGRHVIIGYYTKQCFGHFNGVRSLYLTTPYYTKFCPMPL